MWWATVSRLREMRRHLEAETWASLAAVYPRTFITAYVYFLQAWARYTGSLDSLLRDPDRALVAEVLLSYVCTIDAHIDQIDSRALPLQAYKALTRLPEARAIAGELCARIVALPLPLADKMKMLRCVARYRRGVVNPLLDWVTHPTNDVATVIAAKEQTTGNLWFTWSRLLGHLFDVPDDIAEGAAACLRGLGMMLQIIDDLGDVPVDHRLHAQNIFLAVARQVPQEWRVLSDFLAAQEELFLRWAWVRANLPQSYAATMGLYDRYLDAVRGDQCNPPVAEELAEVVERLRRLSG